MAMLSSFGIDTNARIVKLMIGGGYSSEEMYGFLNSRVIHATEIPAGNGIANARSLARMYAATIGEVDGVRLLRRDSVNRARSPQTDGLGQPEPFSRCIVAVFFEAILEKSPQFDGDFRLLVAVMK